jgi:hypothetical protein
MEVLKQIDLNQMLVAALTLTIAGIIGFWCKDVPIKIYDPSEMKENELLSEHMCFFGTYTFNEDELIYKFSPHFREVHGYKFTKVEDYEPP